jgi:hypothetical protein
MTATYWEIGRRIVQYDQKGEARADYDQQLVEQLANDLSRQFGRGFGRANAPFQHKQSGRRAVFRLISSGAHERS